MSQKKFPDDSSGMVYGPDGPVRRTRANVLAGYVEPIEASHNGLTGREQAMSDEENAWLSAHFMG